MNLATMETTCLRLAPPALSIRAHGALSTPPNFPRICFPTARTSNLQCRASTAQDVSQSPHPDAVKRRLEAEERRKQAVQEQNKSSGGKWWESPGPTNMITCDSVVEFQQHLNDSIENDHLLVVKFFAAHCAACKTMLPKMKQIAEAHDDVTFLKVNAGQGAMNQYCEELGISKVPYFHLYRRGVLVADFSANLTTIRRVRSEVDAYKQ